MMGMSCVSGLARNCPTSPSSSDRKSTRLNSSHDQISYAVFCLKKKKNKTVPTSSEQIIRVRASSHSLPELIILILSHHPMRVQRTPGPVGVRTEESVSIVSNII